MAGNCYNLAMSTHTIFQAPVTLGQKDIDEQTKNVQKSAQSYDQNIPGSATPEHTIVQSPLYY